MRIPSVITARHFNTNAAIDFRKHFGFADKGRSNNQMSRAHANYKRRYSSKTTVRVKKFMSVDTYAPNDGVILDCYKCLVKFGCRKKMQFFRYCRR